MSGAGNTQKALVLLGALLSFVFLQATVARAAVPPCPAVPDAYSPSDPATDTDTIASEIRSLRREQAASCDAIRQAAVETRDAVIADTAKGDDIIAALGDAEDNIVTAIGDIPAPTDSGTEDAPAIVKLANSADIQANALDAYNALREVLWLVAGLIVGSIVVPMLRKVFFP